MTFIIEVHTSKYKHNVMIMIYAIILALHIM